MNPHIPHHKIVMVPHTLIISESEVSIMVLCLLCSSDVQYGFLCILHIAIIADKIMTIMIIITIINM